MSFSKKYSFVFIGMELFVLMLLCLCLFMKKTDRQTDIFQTSSKFIKWVDFNVTSEALDQAFRYDVDTCQAEIHLNWVDGKGGRAADQWGLDYGRADKRYEIL